MVNPGTPYMIDPGLVPAFKLRRRGAEVAYGKTDDGHEIDFAASNRTGRVGVFFIGPRAAPRR